jgi:hypothetical protein
MAFVAPEPRPSDSSTSGKKVIIAARVPSRGCSSTQIRGVCITASRVSTTKSPCVRSTSRARSVARHAVRFRSAACEHSTATMSKGMSSPTSISTSVAALRDATVPVVRCVCVFSSTSRTYGCTDDGTTSSMAPFAASTFSSITYTIFTTTRVRGGRLPTDTVNTSGVSSLSSIRYAPCPASTAFRYSRRASSFSFTTPTTRFALMKASNPHTAAPRCSGNTYFASTLVPLVFSYSWNRVTSAMRSITAAFTRVDRSGTGSSPPCDCSPACTVFTATAPSSVAGATSAWLPTALGGAAVAGGGAGGAASTAAVASAARSYSSTYRSRCAVASYTTNSSSVKSVLPSALRTPCTLSYPGGGRSSPNTFRSVSYVRPSATSATSTYARADDSPGDRAQPAYFNAVAISLPK